MQMFDDAGVEPGPGYRGAVMSSEDTLCNVSFQVFVVYKDLAPNFEKVLLGLR